MGDCWHHPPGKCNAVLTLGFAIVHPRWVQDNPGHTPVRGWVIVGTDGGTRTLLTHHSVVRGEDGRLFDITPLESEGIRGGMRFVPHDGSESDFVRFKDLFQPFLDCDISS